MRFALAAALLILTSNAAFAQTMSGDSFADGKNGAKVHKASGFVCPAKIGVFERDAVGDADPETGADFCSYFALNGVYGTIRITPLTGPYDPKSSFAADFAEQEGTGGKQISERNEKLPGVTALSLYARTYETAKLGDREYRVLFMGAALKNWALEATMEYADPNDTPVEQEFLQAVYAAAETQIGTK